VPNIARSISAGCFHSSFQVLEDLLHLSAEVVLANDLP